ncbi:MAG TPA: ABC transporter ATP-binding protein [Acidimicrobiales bacterium]|nr:ABC transporter ATP-binding protein [Acidimicrobiales bacterium]
MPDLAISCAGVWKSYRMYHQRAHTLKERVLSGGNRYDHFWALRGVDLEVPAGSTMGIIGANGSGKSTLLKVMARILEPNRGALEVNGTVSPLLELGTGFHPELTGRENVFLAGSLLGQTRRDVDGRYDEIVDFAGIAAFMDVPVKNYSSGMYARLAFSVAISVDPEILIVDEVLSVGDASFQLRCHERIGQLRSEGRTIVMVSHSIDTIRALCTEACWIDEGVVRERGLPRDVIASYQDQVRTDSAEDSHRRASRGPATAQDTAATITDVSFRADDGSAAVAFHTGEPFVVRLQYRCSAAVADLVCGVAVYRAGDLAHVFGQNTGQAEIPLPATEDGVVEFRVDRLPLLSGLYLLTVALHDSTGLMVYDWREQEYSFIVSENLALPAGDGMVHVDGHWTLAPATVRS